VLKQISRIAVVHIQRVVDAAAVVPVCVTIETRMKSRHVFFTTEGEKWHDRSIDHFFRDRKTG